MWFRVFQNSPFRNSEQNRTEFREIMKFNIAANKSSFSQVCSLLKMIWNGIPKFILFRKWFGTEFQGFFAPKNVRNGIPRFFSSKHGLERNSEGFSLPRNGSEWNSKGFSIPRNGSEWNSEVVLFPETGRIPTELPSDPFCYIFRGNNFFSSENGNPTGSMSIYEYILNRTVES
jgi:hypothetical protein